MKKILLAVLFLTFSSYLLAEQVPVKKLQKAEKSISGFECADEYAHIIPMLGRGEDFPAFLARDIETELKRQSKRSKLISIKCEGEPDLKAAHTAIEENGKQQKVVSQLSFTIPVQVVVKNGKKEITLQVDQNYSIENLDKPGQQKTTQNFIVKK